MIYVIYCANSFEPGDITASGNGSMGDIKAIPVPCSGRTDILYLTKAFETGADGVALVVCKKGECRYSEGNLRAAKRAQAVASLLEESGLGQNRITVIQVTDSGLPTVVNEINEFRRNISFKIAESARTK